MDDHRTNEHAHPTGGGYYTLKLSYYPILDIKTVQNKIDDDMHLYT